MLWLCVIFILVLKFRAIARREICRGFMLFIQLGTYQGFDINFSCGEYNEPAVLQNEMVHKTIRGDINNMSKIVPKISNIGRILRGST